MPIDILSVFVTITESVYIANQLKDIINSLHVKSYNEQCLQMQLTTIRISSVHDFCLGGEAEGRGGLSRKLAILWILVTLGLVSDLKSSWSWGEWDPWGGGGGGGGFPCTPLLYR